MSRKIVSGAVVVPDGSHWKVARPLGWSEDPGLVCPEESKTDQSQAQDCDINVIVSRFLRSGVAPGMAGSPIYGDFSAVPDYQAALELVQRAEDQFMGLEAKTRARFDNDPAKFLAFCSDSKNAREMADMGLMEPKAVERVNAALRATAEASRASAAAVTAAGQVSPGQA